LTQDVFHAGGAASIVAVAGTAMLVMLGIL
jgi:hypothetical protein